MALELPKIIKSLFPTSKASNEGLNKNQSKIEHINISGTSFKPINPDVDDHHYDVGSLIFDAAPIEGVTTVIQLPDKATILSIIVYGSATVDTLIGFYRKLKNSGAQNEMAELTYNVLKKAIAFPIIDNENFVYFLQGNLSAVKSIYGLKIEYAI